MKFKRMLKRKIYPTWVSTRRVKGYKAYIFKIPVLQVYHFHIIYEDNIIFVSLDEGIDVDSFEECCKIIKEWIRVRIKKL